jgi:hypothetical protein
MFNENQSSPKYSYNYQSIEFHENTNDENEVPSTASSASSNASSSSSSSSSSTSSFDEDFYLDEEKMCRHLGWLNFKFQYIPNETNKQQLLSPNNLNKKWKKYWTVIKGCWFHLYSKNINEISTKTDSPNIKISN